jgi:hypothetical protein
MNLRCAVSGAAQHPTVELDHHAGLCDPEALMDRGGEHLEHNIRFGGDRCCASIAVEEADLTNDGTGTQCPQPNLGTVAVAA